MKRIKQIAYEKIIEDSFNDVFEIDSAGSYLIAITASAKSWWQNTLTRRVFLKKDSLTVTINKDSFRSTETNRLLVGDLWNGNVLKGNEYTIYLAVRLSPGKNTISFQVHKKPFLKEVNIYAIEHDAFRLGPIKISQRDRIPVLAFFFAEEILLTSLSIAATADNHPSDDDDLQLSLDGQIEKNQSDNSHRDWFWCGKVLKGASKIIEKKFNEENAPSRIILYADGTPFVQDISFSLGASAMSTAVFRLRDIQHYRFKGSNGKEDYNRFDKEIVDAVNAWNKEFNDKYPPPESLHPNLVKAMVYIESRMGYFQAKGYPAFPDIMQVADENNPAIHTLNKDGWVDPKTTKVAQENEWKDGKIAELDYNGKANGRAPSESVLWGTRWLYHKAQGITVERERYWRPWKEAVRLYNGQGNKNYAEEVYSIFLHGIDQRDKKNKIKIFSASLFFFSFLLFSTFGVSAVLNHSGDTQSPAIIVNEAHPSDILRGIIPQNVRKIMREKMKIYERRDDYYYGDLFQEAVQLCRQYDGQCFGEYIFSSYLPEILSKSVSTKVFLQAIEPFDVINASNSFYDDLDNDGEGELVAVLMDFLNHEHLEILVVDEQGSSLHSARAKIDRPYSWGPPRVIDLTGDGIPEIVVYSSGGRRDAQAFIYQYRNKELRKFFEITNAHNDAEFIFTDQNKNSLPEILVRGKKIETCKECRSLHIEQLIEYNKKVKKFETLHHSEAEEQMFN